MNKTPDKTLFITGGHITPALALIDEMRVRHPDFRIVLVGRNIALEGTSEASVEKQLVEKRGAEFLPITAGRLSRIFGVSAIVSFFKIPVGGVQAFWYCLTQRPKIVVSFGGYVALPIAAAAYSLGIPVVTHEQTRVTGLANRIIGHLARKIFLTFDDQHVSKKAVVTGLPIRQELTHPPTAAPFAVQKNTPIVYITGGSTGAVSLNELLFPLIGQLVADYTVIHQTGKQSREKAMQVRQQLEKPVRDRYIVGEFFDGSTTSWILNNATLIVGRSGANTVMEVAVLGKTMLCIPLPWSGGGEQHANALWLKGRGLADVLPQKDANEKSIMSMITALVGQAPKNTDKKSTDLPTNGASRMADGIDAILGW